MMDKEMKEYIEQILFASVKREDIEKLRQEMKSNFRQLKEENRNQILGWIGELKAEIENLRKEAKIDTRPIQEDFKEGIQKLKLEIQSSFHQPIQTLEASLQKIKEEIPAAIHQSKQEMSHHFLTLKEEGLSQMDVFRIETKADVDGLRLGLERLSEQIGKVIEEVSTLDEKMRRGFNEIKEELGSMIKLSYSDLEKRLNAMEARIKALEKMVLP